MRELVAAAEALAAHVRPRGDRLAIVTNGGGPGVMAADRAADLGLPLAELSAETVGRLARALPANWSHANPVDLIGDAGAERYAAALSACLADPGVDGVIVILTPQAMTPAQDAAQAVADSAKGSEKPVIACWMGEASVGAARVQLRHAGVPEYPGPEMAVEAFASLAAFYRNQRALLETPGPPQRSARCGRARALLRAALRRAQDPRATESKALSRPSDPCGHYGGARRRGGAAAAVVRFGRDEARSPTSTTRASGGVRLEPRSRAAQRYPRDDASVARTGRAASGSLHETMSRALEES